MRVDTSSAERLFDAIGAQLVLCESFGGERPRVGDDYELHEILGAGGFGLICRATNLRLRREVALKLFPLPAGGMDSGVREALREARSLARLDHPNVVAVYAAGESEVVTDARLPCAYVEMQLVSGQTLRSWLEQQHEALTVLEVLLAAGRGLASAHRKGLVHRDFKPENLMVDGDGQARVIDFGLALAAELEGDAPASPALASWNPTSDAHGARATLGGQTPGTPGYMAPEAVQGRPMAASDQFAFAVVLRESLTGRHPFAAPELPAITPPQHGTALFAELDPVIERAMAAAPADRFASIDELCDALEALAYPTDARAPGRRRLPALWLGLGVSAAAIAVAVAGSRLAQPEQPARDLDALATPSAQPGPASPPPRGSAAPVQPQPAQPQPIPGPLAGAASPPPSCDTLEAWAGSWQVGAKVLWTEFAYQLDWRLEHEYELRIEDRCAVHLTAREYPPRLEGELPGEPVEVEAVGVAAFEQGAWRLPLRVAFPDERRTYGSDEHYELVLSLHRNEGYEALAGSFRRVNAKGYPIRTGMLLAARGAVPELLNLSPAQLPCAARCHLECAGELAARACRKRACEGLDDGGELCAAPSPDFDLPMRAISAQLQLRDGRDIMQEALERSGQGHTARCPSNALALEGRWLVGASVPPQYAAQLLELELRAQGCELHGSAAPFPASEPTDPPLPVHGYVTGAGTWVIEASAPQPWFPAPLILTGTYETGPALGSDASEPPRKLSARKL